MLTQTRSIGDEIDGLFEIREGIRALEDQVKEQKAVYEAKEKTLMERLEQEGIEKAGGRKASVSISTSTVGQVENWDELYRYISRNKAFHLLERRLSNGAYRELLVQRAKLGVPGVVPYMKKRISLKVN